MIFQMKKNKRTISFGVLILVILLGVYYFWEIITFSLIGLVGISNESKKIEVTSDYIKTGWLLHDTQNFRLAIQPINVHSLQADTAKFEDFVENKTYTADSCMILFGKDNIDKIYFKKKSKGWTWDKICDLKTEEIIEKERTFTFNKNSFYRILGGYWRGDSSYKIFVHMDNNGNVKTYMKLRDGKTL